LILEIVSATGPALMGGVSGDVMHRAIQFKRVVRKGVGMHAFEPKVIRDDWRKIQTRWCKTCNFPKRAWIHDVYSGDELLSLDSRILELEREDVKWRFANDPEWVQVFGHEFDPKTFKRIPQMHNGECGGPHDSCPLCNWEREQKKLELNEKRRKDNALRLADEKHRDHVNRQEVKQFADLLWTLWNTTHDSEYALEEWEDLRDEIGMLASDVTRRAIKDSEIFKRISYVLQADNPGKQWKRREEVWAGKLRRERESRRYVGDPYTKYY
jgi:hypothetical protein